MTGVDQGEALAALLDNQHAIMSALHSLLREGATGQFQVNKLSDRMRATAALREHIQANMEGER